MKYTDISGKNLSELNALLKEKKVLLFTLRQKLKTMQLTNPNEHRNDNHQSDTPPTNT